MPYASQATPQLLHSDLDLDDNCSGLPNLNKHFKGSACILSFSHFLKTVEAIPFLISAPQ